MYLHEINRLMIALLKYFVNGLSLTVNFRVVIMSGWDEISN